MKGKMKIDKEEEKKVTISATREERMWVTREHTAE